MTQVCKYAETSQETNITRTQIMVMVLIAQSKCIQVKTQWDEHASAIIEH